MVSRGGGQRSRAVGVLRPFTTEGNAADCWAVLHGTAGYYFGGLIIEWNGGPGGVAARLFSGSSQSRVYPVGDLGSEAACFE